jgi:hypothetical protein
LRDALEKRGQVRMKKLVAMLGMAVSLAAAACSGVPGEPDGPGLNASVPTDAASIIGDITQVERNGDAMRILVEQIPTRNAGYPIAWISINPSTRVLRRAEGTVSRGSSRELAKGMRVQVWFTGPVAESYPVQAKAGTVLIER